MKKKRMRSLVCSDSVYSYSVVNKSLPYILSQLFVFYKQNISFSLDVVGTRSKGVVEIKIELIRWIAEVKVDFLIEINFQRKCWNIQKILIKSYVDVKLWGLQCYDTYWGIQY